MDWDHLLTLLSYALNTLRDIGFFILCVHTIDSDKPGKARRMPLALGILAAGSLLSLRIGDAASLFHLSRITDSDFIISLVRTAIRFGYIFAYIRILKRTSRATALYDAMLLSAACIIVHNIFLTPVTRPLVIFTAHFTDSALINKFLCILALNGATCLLYGLIYYFIPLGAIKNVDASRNGMMLMFLLVAQFLNGTIKLSGAVSGDQRGQPVQMSVYTILLQLILLLAIYYLERFHRTTRKQTRIQIENNAMRSLVDSIE